MKKHFERIEFAGDLLLPLREYPVRGIISMKSEKGRMKNGDIGAEFYRVIPDCRDVQDIPSCLSVSPALGLIRGVSSITVHYWAGYQQMKNEELRMNNDVVPADLASACLELAAWNMSRYRGRRIGMTGNVRGNGKDGEHLEMSMPENVRGLLEPYRRRVI
jgi:hypothetical protein